MIKVKLVRLPNEKNHKFSEREIRQVGKTFEAFELDWGEDGMRYALYLKDEKTIFYAPIEWCEIIENINDIETIKNKKRFFLVEDGSVDTDYIEDDLGIPCIVYRQGANKPELLEL